MEQRIFDSLLLTAYLTGFTEFTPLDKSKKRSFYGNSVSHRVNVTYNYEKNCKKMIIFFKSGILRKNSFFEGSFSNYLADSQFWIPASAGMTAVEYRIRESTHKSAFISVHPSALLGTASAVKIAVSRRLCHLLSIRLRSGQVYDLPREMAASPISWGELLII